MLDGMDTDEKSRLVIVVGSVREGRFGPTVASWVAGRAREHGGFDVGVVVSYGGAAGGRHAVLHLENVLTELHAVTIRDGLSFPSYFTGWQDGNPLDEQAAGYAKTLLVQLDWWARALRSARAAVPYPGGA